MKRVRLRVTGEPMILPFPAFLIFRDRDDGTLWFLTHSIHNGLDYVAINDDMSNLKQDYEIVDTMSLSDHPGVRLFVRGGRLGMEDTSELTQNRRIDTRKSMNHYTLEIHAPIGWVHWPDMICFERLEFRH